MSKPGWFKFMHISMCPPVVCAVDVAWHLIFFCDQLRAATCGHMPLADDITEALGIKELVTERRDWQNAVHCPWKLCLSPPHGGFSRCSDRRIAERSAIKNMCRQAKTFFFVWLSGPWWRAGGWVEACFDKSLFVYSVTNASHFSRSQSITLPLSISLSTCHCSDLPHSACCQIWIASRSSVLSFWSSLMFSDTSCRRIMPFLLRKSTCQCKYNSQCCHGGVSTMGRIHKFCAKSSAGRTDWRAFQLAFILHGGRPHRKFRGPLWKEKRAIMHCHCSWVVPGCSTKTDTCTFELVPARMACFLKKHLRIDFRGSSGM